VDGRRARLGRAGFVGACAQPGEGAELWFAFEHGPARRFAFRDMPRPGAAGAVSAFKARGLRVEVLSGDSEVETARCAKAVGADAWSSGLTPQEKSAAVDRLTAAGGKVLMIGDGLNDAAALAKAHASMAPSSALDISQNAADMVLCNGALSSAPAAIDIARRARRRALENFAFSALYNLLAAPAAMLGLINPLVAALAMSGSSLAVMLNALRLAWPERRRA
jgi:Cu2+-exporting ATPase